MTKGEDRVEKRDDSTQNDMTTDTFSPIILKDCAPIVIPPQLANLPGARFIRIKDKTKVPVDAKWNTERNYPSTHAAIKGWLRGGHPYGVVTGLGGACCLDIDELEIATEIGLLEKIPKTLVVATGGGGRHHWFEAYGIEKMVLSHDGIHIGEFQATNAYAMGAGSTHPNGNKYEIIENCELAKITKDELVSMLTSCGVEFKKREKPTCTTISNYKTNNHDISLLDIAKPVNAQERQGPHGTEIYGEHPVHGSKTGHNLHINVRTNQWYCHRHKNGGGWPTWLAINTDILRCEDVRPGCLRGEKYSQVIEAAKKMGLIRETPRTIIEQVTGKIKQLWKNVKKIIWTETLDNLTQENLLSRPTDKLIALIGPARQGKTTWGIDELLEAGEGNMIAPNHAVSDHEFNIFTVKGGKGGVHVEGMHQPGMCRYPEYEQCVGRKCKLYPDQTRDPNDIGETHMELLTKSIKLLAREGNLTKKQIPSDMCPYYTLIRASYDAPYVFTVVNNIESLFGTSVRNRKLTIIDEDTSLNFFYPKSIEIASAYRRHDALHITTCLDNKDIENEMEKVKTADGKKKLKVYVEKILQIKATLAEMDGKNLPLNTIPEAIENILTDWIPLKCNIENTTTNGENDATFNEVINALMNSYEPQRVSMIVHGGSAKVFLLADERFAVMNMDWFEKAEQVIMIGAALAEMFVNQMGEKIIEIPTFKFENNFIVLAVGLDKNDDDKGKKGKIKKKLIETMKKLQHTKDTTVLCPMLFLAGSKDEQEQITNRIGGNSLKLTTEREYELKRLHASGLIAGLYQNSTISRGQDVDQYNIMFAIGTEFAKPFWSAVDREMADKITIDETTNSVLRISPTTGDGITRTKVILISEDDVWKIKYLGSRVIKTNATAKRIANVLKKLEIPGESKFDEATKSIRIIKPGVDATNIYEKMYAALLVTDETLEDDVLENASALILRYLRKNLKKTFTKTEIRDKTELPNYVILPVLEILRYSKKVNITMVGTTAKYGHIREPKSQRDISISHFSQASDNDFQV